MEIYLAWSLLLIPLGVLFIGVWYMDKKFKQTKYFGMDHQEWEDLSRQWDKIKKDREEING